jgi:quercetin dioxygenase-like cupin family protein
MAVVHAQPGQAVDVGPLGAGLAATRTHALFKSRDLEVIRLVLLKGQSLPMHRVPGEITVQCLEGLIEVSTDSGRHGLQAGQLLYLQGGAEHDVRGIEDASALVTIALR